MTREDWMIFLNSVENPLTDNERAVAIADVLDAGKPSLLFCQMLAGMIRPRGKNATGYRLELRRKRNGRPKSQLGPVGNEMERLVDGEGKTVDVAVAEIQRRFGVRGNSKRKCETALKAAREFTQLERLLDEPVQKAPQ